MLKPPNQTKPTSQTTPKKPKDKGLHTWVERECITEIKEAVFWRAETGGEWNTALQKVIRTFFSLKKKSSREKKSFQLKFKGEHGKSCLFKTEGTMSPYIKTVYFMSAKGLES